MDNFVIQTGLTVGPTTISAITGNISVGKTTIDGNSGDIHSTGNIFMNGLPILAGLGNVTSSGSGLSTTLWDIANSPTLPNTAIAGSMYETSSVGSYLGVKFVPGDIAVVLNDGISVVNITKNAYTETTQSYPTFDPNDIYTVGNMAYATLSSNNTVATGLVSGTSSILLTSTNMGLPKSAATYFELKVNHYGDEFTQANLVSGSSKTLAFAFYEDSVLFSAMATGGTLPASGISLRITENSTGTTAVFGVSSQLATMSTPIPEFPSNLNLVGGDVISFAIDINNNLKLYLNGALLNTTTVLHLTSLVNPSYGFELGIEAICTTPTASANPVSVTLQVTPATYSYPSLSTGYGIYGNSLSHIVGQPYIVNDAWNPVTGFPVSKVGDALIVGTPGEVNGINYTTGQMFVYNGANWEQTTPANASRALSYGGNFTSGAFGLDTAATFPVTNAIYTAAGEQLMPTSTVTIANSTIILGTIIYPGDLVVNDSTAGVKKLTEYATQEVNAEYNLINNIQFPTVANANYVSGDPTTTMDSPIPYLSSNPTAYTPITSNFGLANNVNGWGANAQAMEVIVNTSLASQNGETNYMGLVYSSTNTAALLPDGSNLSGAFANGMLNVAGSTATGVTTVLPTGMLAIYFNCCTGDLMLNSNLTSGTQVNNIKLGTKGSSLSDGDIINFYINGTIFIAALNGTILYSGDLNVAHGLVIPQTLNGFVLVADSIATTSGQVLQGAYTFNFGKLRFNYCFFDAMVDTTTTSYLTLFTKLLPPKTQRPITLTSQGNSITSISTVTLGNTLTATVSNVTAGTKTVVLNTSQIITPESNVAGLPPSATIGTRYCVLDALSPVFLGNVVGGGTVVCPVMFNGTTWIVG